jgi:hypothetical protein
MSESVHQLHDRDCRHISVGNIQSNCKKRTCLKSHSAAGFSAILLCCELCQAVQVHKRYRYTLRFYRRGFDITEYIALPNYAHRQGLKFQLDWALSRTFKLIIGSESFCEMCVHLNQLTLLPV